MDNPEALRRRKLHNQNRKRKVMPNQKLLIALVAIATAVHGYSASKTGRIITGNLTRVGATQMATLPGSADQVVGHGLLNAPEADLLKGKAPVGALGGWAPGILPHYLPEGTGYLLPAGSDFVMQVHYHRDGRLERDRTQVGLYFAKKPLEKQMLGLVVPGRFKTDAKPGSGGRFGGLGGFAIRGGGFFGSFFSGFWWHDL